MSGEGGAGESRSAGRPNVRRRGWHEKCKGSLGALRGLGALVAVAAAAAAGPAGALPMMHPDLDGTGQTWLILSPGTHRVHVDVRLSEVPPGSDGLGLFGFSFAFDLTGASLVAGPTLGPLWTGNSGSQVSGGVVSVIADRFGDTTNVVAGDDILLASLALDVTLAPGESVAFALGPYLAPGGVVLHDGTPLDVPGGLSYSAALVIPEPGAALPLLSGLLAGALAVGALRRRAPPRR